MYRGQGDICTHVQVRLIHSWTCTACTLSSMLSPNTPQVPLAWGITFTLVPVPATPPRRYGSPLPQLYALFKCHFLRCHWITKFKCTTTPPQHSISFFPVLFSSLAPNTFYYITFIFFFNTQSPGTSRRLKHIIWKNLKMMQIMSASYLDKLFSVSSPL